MKISEAIKIHRAAERNAVKMAVKYAKTKEWKEAATFYRAADFHRKLHEVLEVYRRR